MRTKASRKNRALKERGRTKPASRKKEKMEKRMRRPTPGREHVTEREKTSY